MIPVVELQIDILDLFENLQGKSKELFVQILEFDVKLDAWTPDTDNPIDARIVIAEHLSSYWYKDYMRGNETLQQAGIFGISPETFSLIRSINATKNDIEDKIVELRNYGETPRNASLLKFFEDNKGKRHPRVREHLGLAQLHRINLLQLYRRYSTFHLKPEHISFTWSYGNRAIKRLDVEQAHDMIHKLIDDDDDKQTFHDLINRLDEYEELAVARPIKTNLKANVKFPDQTRKCIMAHSPISYLQLESERMPLYRWPGPIPERRIPRLRRSDRKLQEKPYIPPLHIYLYQKSTVTID